MIPSPNVSIHALEQARSHASINPQAALATPLPADNDDDFPPTHKILKTVALPSTKVAGARRPVPELKGKGKQNLIDLPAVSQSGKGKRKAASPLRPANGKKQRGRAVGVANYSIEDLDALFDILEERLPLGGHGWNSAADEYNAWAQENGRPSRTAKSLEQQVELKFKQVSLRIHLSILHELS
jgi:hypothetical protein